MRTDDFDFELPEERIALEPCTPRDAARMLVVRPDELPMLDDRSARELPVLLSPGDLLVVNNTRVIPAALSGTRSRRPDFVTQVHANLIRRTGLATWEAFARPARRLAVGDQIVFAPNLSAEVTAKQEGGLVSFAFNRSGADLDAAIAETGAMPLPPYIQSKRAADDRDRDSYQTVYAKHDGAVASPTAGLHFTDGLLTALSERGVARTEITLHVGAGTFLPVKSENVDEHEMHSEWAEVSAATAREMNETRARGGRIVAVGTTVLRTLETAANEHGAIEPFKGETNIFIKPGHAFKGVDALMTNFHLPRSTLFMLVAAFSGLDTMQAAYAHAINAQYRFYSYGDSSLLFPAKDAQ